jgi:HAD superfamily hydrolase (TIGR01509 family)
VHELVIFDCDGVLVDSDRISLRVQAERFAELGLSLSYEACVRDFLGIGMRATLAIVSQRIGRPVPDLWVEGLDAAVRQAFLDGLTVVPGIVEVLDALAGPSCIASSGSHEKMRFTLGLTGLHERFAGRIFSGEEVPHGKPAPDLFLHAAERMGVAADRCIVIEDSPAGVAGAKAAGMRALGFAASTPAERLAEADVVFTTMAELPALLQAS